MRSILLVCIVLACFSVSEIQSQQNIFPSGQWNLTNNVIPGFLPLLYPFMLQLAVTPQMRSVAHGHSGFYEVWSTYDAVARGRYVPRSFKRPVSEHTTRNKNIALSYYFMKYFGDIAPKSIPVMRSAFLVLGLNPDYTNENTNLATGDNIAAANGNKIGNVIIDYQHDDGFNQLGDMGGRQYHRTNYSDYTGYVPVNSAFELRSVDRWQPNLHLDAKGRQVIQTYVTPQFALTKTFVTDLDEITCPRPRTEYRTNRNGYFAKMNEVIQGVAGLTDYKKAVAEFFDNKLFGIGAMARFLHGDQSYQIDNFCKSASVVNMAMKDAMAATWKLKTQFDAVRPFSVIRHFNNGKTIRGWGGPGKGTVNMDGAEWSSYLTTDAFPEYPSGTSCLCHAFAGAARTYKGNDTFGFTYTMPVGFSVIEPGIVPATPQTISYATFTDMATECAESRIYAGVHFREAIEAAKPYCTLIGVKVAQAHLKLIRGIGSDSDLLTR